MSEEVQVNTAHSLKVLFHFALESICHQRSNFQPSLDQKLILANHADKSRVVTVLHTLGLFLRILYFNLST